MNRDSNRSTTADTPRLTVLVTENAEPIDFDAWAARYVRLLIAADRAQHQSKEAA